MMHCRPFPWGTLASQPSFFFFPGGGCRCGCGYGYGCSCVQEEQEAGHQDEAVLAAHPRNLVAADGQVQGRSRERRKAVARAIPKVLLRYGMEADAMDAAAPFLVWTLAAASAGLRKHQVASPLHEAAEGRTPQVVAVHHYCY